MTDAPRMGIDVVPISTWEALRGAYDRDTAYWRDKCHDAEEEVIRQHTALVELVAWLRGNAETFSSLARVHGIRPTVEQLTEHRRVWALVAAAIKTPEPDEPDDDADDNEEAV